MADQTTCSVPTITTTGACGRDPLPTLLNRSSWMATWRDLALPRQEEVWRELRGLRSGVPGPARSNSQRRSVFIASLEQAQQFTEAAMSAGPATRPVQIFYALSQFGRAISAASTLVSGADWRLKGHGIGTKNLDASKGLASVGVTPHAKGSLPGVAKALGARPFDADVELTLAALWPLIPETERVPLPGAREVSTLSVNPTRVVQDGAERWVRLHLHPVSSQVRVKAEADRAALEEFLSRYPSLKGWARDALPNPSAAAWGQADGLGGEHLEISVPIEQGIPQYEDEGRATARARATAYRGPNDLFVFPSVGAMGDQVHPLLVWWAVLFGLSILARYEPEHWASIIDIDQSADANAVEHVLEQALAVVPHLALRAIQEVAGP
ncbi:YaaC family protein [Streptomyces sp. NPDC054987]